MRFRRAVASGLVQEYSLERANAKDVRAFVRVEDPALGARIASLLDKPKPFPLVSTELLAPYRNRDGKITDMSAVPDARYAICHASCLERAVGDVTEELERYAMPFFRRVETLVGVDAAYHGDPGSLLPTYLHFAIDRPPGFVVAGTAVAVAVKRPDLDAWIERYRQRLRSWGAEQDRPAMIERYEAFVRALAPRDG